MELVIYQNGEPFGTACVEEKGARLHFCAKCPFIPGIYRLYIWKTDGKALPLGVLLPENGMLTLDRTISRPRQMPPGLASFRCGVLCAGDTSSFADPYDAARHGHRLYRVKSAAQPPRYADGMLSAWCHFEGQSRVRDMLK